MRGHVEYLKSGFGFIKGLDGKSYFFIPSTMSESSPVQFAEIKRGMPVTFIPTETAKGLRAESVEVMTEHRLEPWPKPEGHQ